MGHFCVICKRSRPNEAFSGKGHRTHICRKCQGLPKDEREIIERQDEIAGFLKQSNISRKNIKRLEALASFNDPETAELADIVLKIACFHPYKRKRMQALVRERKDLMQRIEDSGLLFAAVFTRN